MHYTQNIRQPRQPRQPDIQDSQTAGQPDSRIAGADAQMFLSARERERECVCVRVGKGVRCLCYSCVIVPVSDVERISYTLLQLAASERRAGASLAPVWALLKKEAQRKKQNCPNQRGHTARKQVHPVGTVEPGPARTHTRRRACYGTMTNGLCECGCEWRRREMCLLLFLPNMVMLMMWMILMPLSCPPGCV